MTTEQTELRKLVRRDLAVAGGGSLVAIWLLAVLTLGKFGVISQLTAYRVVVAVSAVVAGGCLYSWVAGPRSMLRERYFVLVPAFLVAGPALYSAYQLGGGAGAVIVSSAVGFFAAVVLGLAVSSRRRSARRG